jgi:tetratricopeptide (TPR) repeat protein
MIALHRVALAAILSVAISATAHDETTQDKHSEGYGSVHFPVSCSPAAQQQFDRAMTMLHSFFFPETIKAFTAVVELDPQCAMAYWGIAISQRPNPLVGPWDAATLQRGVGAIAKGKALAWTDREIAWLDSMELFFKDYQTVDQNTRARRYEQAMARVYEQYPDDDEAGVFYALALNETASLADKTYTQQLKAAAILERLDAKHPDHPGITHYLIHSYDYRPLAERGIAAANKYASIAPSAPHALHMPSHIFTTLGMWQPSIDANQRTVDSAQAYAAKNHPGVARPDVLHAYDFMEYAYLQLGQDAQAKRLVDDLAGISKVTRASIVVDAAFAAIPARYTLERADWQAAALLTPYPSPYPYARAIGHFTRALGAARTGKPDQTRSDIASLRALGDEDLAHQQEYWAGQTNILIQAASAWLALAEGKKDEAKSMMRSAVALEDGAEKHVAMENRLYPMHELLGYLLLETGESQAALVEFETALAQTPNRLRGYYGAATAATLAGDAATARSYYAKLLNLGADPAAARPEFAEARRYLARK